MTPRQCVLGIFVLLLPFCSVFSLNTQGDTISVHNGLISEDEYYKQFLINIGYGFYSPLYVQPSEWEKQAGFSEYGNGGCWWARFKLEEENFLKNSALWLSIESESDKISNDENWVSISNFYLLLSLQYYHPL